MESFLPFFMTLFAGLIFSVAFKKIQVPWVITLILAGIIIGPYGFRLFEVDQTVRFISESGLVLMMFMAGLETQLSSFKKFHNRMYLLSFINGFLPFIAGFFITYFITQNINTSILIGIIFISSSVAVVIPSLEANELISTPLGSSVLATSIVQDVASLILLSIFLQTERNITNLPLVAFYPLVFGILIAMRYLLPKIQNYLSSGTAKKEIFQRDLRAVLLILFGMVIVFEVLGLHPIIAGFFTGLILSESLKSEVLLGKIRAISYGIFVPTFFIVVGTQTDISQFSKAGDFILLTLMIVAGSIISKFLSGSFGAKIVGFNKAQSLFFGASSIPQLSTTLAATFTGLKFGLISTEIATSLIILSVVSTIIGPLLVSSMNKFVLSTRDVEQSLK